MRATGRRRFEHLLDVAERLLRQRHGSGEPLSIQEIARAANVPSASVYHFLPGPAAVSVALAGRYLDAFGELVGAPLDDVDWMTWRQIVAKLLGRTVAYYRAHPHAQHLILGGGHGWAARRSDRASSRMLVDGAAALLVGKFPDADPDALHEAVVIGVTIGEAVWSLSIAENGEITDTFAADALTAVCAYLAARLETPPTMP